MKKEWLKNDRDKIVFRDLKHPFVSDKYLGLGALKGTIDPFDDLFIGMHYRPLPKDQWETDSQKLVTEPITLLQCRVTTEDVKNQVLKVMELFELMAHEVLKAHPKKFEKEKYELALKTYRTEVEKALAEGSLSRLHRTFTRIRFEGPTKTFPDRADMDKLWSDEDLKPLKWVFYRLSDRIELGDPLVVTRSYGRGRTVAVLTTAGTSSGWNNWGDGPAQWTYPNFIRPMQQSLIEDWTKQKPR